MYMVKSNGGTGTVSNLVLENFIGHGNAYSLDIDQYWSSMDPISGDGVQLNNIKITNWTSVTLWINDEFASKSEGLVGS